MQSREVLEKRLAESHGKHYCKLVGSGTTALYLILMAQQIENQRVALPNNVCMNVLLAIYFSNNTPIFIDIEKETLGLDISLLEKEKIDTLIAVHSYGNVCDVQATKEYCQRNGVLFVEDVAIAQGIEYDGNKLGSFGDVSILSFGAGKILDIGHGGAILTDDEVLFSKILLEYDKLTNVTPKHVKEISLIGKEHTRLYNLDFGISFAEYSTEFKQRCLTKKNYYLYRFNDAYQEALTEGLNNLDQLLDKRQENAKYLTTLFKDANLANVKVLEPKFGSAYWRFNIFVDKYRNELFSYLLRKKYKVSSWQHSVDTLFEEKVAQTPVSKWVGKHIINIWVNEDIDNTYLNAISKDIIDFLKGKEND